jgi:antitoxin (DNA-binding transcriptional repressor) of toxin-antitoxin stability system
MREVSTQEFRANQSKILSAAKSGEEVVLKSKVGKFKLVPISEKEFFTAKVCHGLHQVKAIEEGELPRRTIQDLLDELE